MAIPRRILSKVENNARSRDHKVLITLADICVQYEKQKGICWYTRVPLGFNNIADKHGKKTLDNCSVDRLDPDKDYATDNFALVQQKINLMKGFLPEEEFLYWCNRVARFHPRKADDLPPEYVFGRIGGFDKKASAERTNKKIERYRKKIDN